MAVLYVSIDDVKTRLAGKVRFSEDDTADNEVGKKLLTQLIEEAEAQVEIDLSPRYAVPFLTVEGKEAKKLPSRSYLVIRQLVIMMSCIKILETDFGKGSAINGRNYSEKLKEMYNDMVENRLLKKHIEQSRQWAYPPMEGLKLAYFNTEADDGYAGTVLNTSSSGRDQNYSPSWQVNSPLESWWNGVFDE